jgi:CheY-like chemotaxis protein
MGLRVLIVEDEAIVSEELKMRVELFGHRVLRVVPTGKDAIDAVKKLNPDLVLMDICLKGELTGIEAATIIRNLISSRLPFIFVSASAEHKVPPNISSTLLRKPFAGNDLRKAIERVIEESNAHPEYHEYVAVGR